MKFRDAMELPPAMTQEGVASSAWVELRHLSQYLRPLIAEESVRERVSHVKGIRQRRKVYDLTESGQHAAYRLRDRVRAETVRVQEGGSVRDETVATVVERLAGRLSLLDVVHNSTQGGPLDLNALIAAPVSPLVEMLGDAPHPDRFVGRARELELLTAADAGPRVFVVRGVAGIGKSSIAARACELLRGRRNLFWHTLRPWDTRVSVLSALGDFLASVGKPGLRSVVARGEAAEAAEVLREDLPGANAFLVLDDAHLATPDVVALFRFLKEAISDAPDVQALVLTRRALAFYDRRDVSLAKLVKEIDLAGLRSEDIAAFLSPDLDVAIGKLGKRLGGHPLFLQLVRSATHAPIHDGALHDMDRFLEEEIYTELSEPERTALKTASLYRVAVPREALYSDPSVTHDVILSLINRVLLRPVGAEGLEVHDTIRAYFAGILTAAETATLGGFAAAQLRGLASRAHAMGNLVGCIDYLSNAIELPARAEERADLLEALGDENDKIGDFPAALTAYKEALRLAAGFEIPARLHRKTAAALETRGELAAALRELEMARRVLGENVTVERGWLDLVQSRVASGREEPEKAREAALSALDVFGTFHDTQAVVRTLYELGFIEMDAHPGSLEAAKGYLERGLALAEGLGNRELIAKFHTGLANLYGDRLGDIGRALEHMSAVEADPEVLQDLQVRRSFRMLQGWFHLDIRADFPAAERYFTEAADLARQLHFARSLVFTRYAFALSHYYQGRVVEARDEFDSYGKDIRARGYPAFAVEALLLVAECDLRLGDLRDFQRVREEIARPELAEGRRARPVRVQVLQAVDYVLQGNLEGARAAFDAALRLAGTGDWVEEAILLHIVHLYCGIALRACGRRDEGETHLREAREFLERYHLKARLSILPETERELAETLSRAMERFKNVAG